MSLFDSAANYILEDELVRLEPLTPAHLDLLSPIASEGEVWKFSTIPVYDSESLGEYIRLAMEGKAKGNEYPFAVYDKRSKTYAGSTRFYDISTANSTLQLGYTWYGLAYQGTGLNKHCKFLLLQFAFEELGMMRVEFRANLLNERSIAAMKSIGCVQEGVLRSNIHQHNGPRRNTIVLSILKEEWDGRVKGLIRGKW